MEFVVVDWEVAARHLEHVAWRYGVTIRKKSDSRFMRMLALLFRIVPGVDSAEFMHRYSTTIGSTIYLSDGVRNARSTTIVLAHELIHVEDSRRRGHLRFALSYLAPQVFALLSLLALFAFVWPPALFALAALVFLAPWGSSGRTRAEIDAYGMTLAVMSFDKGRYGEIPEWVLAKFDTGAYYWMCRRTGFVHEELRREAAKFHEGTYWDGSPMRKDIYEGIKAVGSQA